MSLVEKYEKLLGIKYEILINLENKYNEYKNRAKSKNMQFTLSFKDFTQFITSYCYICNKSGKTNLLGLDRLNNKWGYIPFNVAGCCFECNRAKNDMTFTEFKTWLKSINPDHYLCKIK